MKKPPIGRRNAPSLKDTEIVKGGACINVQLENRENNEYIERNNNSFGSSSSKFGINKSASD